MDGVHVRDTQARRHGERSARQALHGVRVHHVRAKRPHGPLDRGGDVRPPEIGEVVRDAAAPRLCCEFMEAVRAGFHRFEDVIAAHTQRHDSDLGPASFELGGQAAGVDLRAPQYDGWPETREEEDSFHRSERHMSGVDFRSLTISGMDERVAMREAWNERARRDPFHYVETKHWNGDVSAFFALGEERCRLLVDPVLRSRRVSGVDSTALDLGCGVGRMTRALARRFGTVIGVDVSDEMVRRARELHPPNSYRNVRFAESDGVSIALDDESVDFVFSYEVLQHMPSRDVILRTLAEIRRVLRPGGFALVHVHTAPSLGVILRSRLVSRLPARLVRTLKTFVLRQDPLVADPAFRGSPPLRPAEIRPFFARAGLAVEQVRGDPTHVVKPRAFVIAVPDNVP